MGKLLVGINQFYWWCCVEFDDFSMKLICGPRRGKSSKSPKSGKTLCLIHTLGALFRYGVSIPMMPHFVWAHSGLLWSVLFLLCSEASPDSRRWMSSALSVRISLLRCEKWPLFSPRGKLEYALCTPGTRLDLVSSVISLQSHPVLLRCITLSVITGIQKPSLEQEYMEDLLMRTINSNYKTYAFTDAVYSCEEPSQLL